MAAAGQAGHQAISGAGPEARADVAGGGERVQEDCRGEHRRAWRQGLGAGNDPQCLVDGRADQGRVADCSQPGAAACW